MITLPSLGEEALGIIGLRDARARWLLRRQKARRVQPLEAINGGFMLIPRALWRQLGGFDESYFLYGEDADLCRRIKAAGRLIAQVKASQVTHDVGSGDCQSPMRQHFKRVASAHYVNRNFSSLKAALFKCAMWLICLRQGLFAYLRRAASPDAMPNSGSDAPRISNPLINPSSWMGGFDAPGADPRRAREALGVARQSAPASLRQ